MHFFSLVKKNSLIILVLLVFGLWYFSNIQGSLLADEVFYSKMATDLLRGNFVGESSVRPLMQYFFALGQIVFGQTGLAMRFFPVLFSLGALALIYLIALEFCKSRIVAICSSILAGTTPIYAQYSVRGMFDIPLAFFILLLFFLYIKSKHSPKQEIFYLMGIVSILAIATKTYAAFFVAALFLIILLRKGFCFFIGAINEFQAFFSKNFSALKKYFLLFLMPSVVFSVFFRNQLLDNWLNMYSAANRQHVIEKLPSVFTYFLSNIGSIEVFAIIFVLCYLMLFVFWFLMVFFFLKIFLQKPEKLMAIEYCIFGIAAFFLGISGILQAPIFALAAFGLIALLNIALIFTLKKETKSEEAGFFPAFFQGAIISAIVVYLPFLPKIVDTFSRIFYSNYAYLVNPLSAFVLNQWVNPAPFWAYFYWISTYGGAVYVSGFVIALCFFIFSKFGKKLAENDFLELLLFFAVPFLLLSIITMKFPRYLISIIPFLSVFLAVGFFKFAKLFFSKIDLFKKSTAKLAVCSLILLILLPGIILPYPPENQSELFKNLPGIEKNFQNNLVPHYIAEWGIANAVSSPPIVALKYPDIHVDSGMEGAARIVKEYALRNSDKNVFIIAWNPYGSLQFYMKEIPKNLEIVDRIYLTIPEVFEKLKKGEVDIVVQLPADPEMSGFRKEIEWVEQNYKSKKETGGYVAVYFFK